MNKLNTNFSKPVGFEWDDADWLQESVRDAFYGLLSAFGIDPEDSFILSGCTLTYLGSGIYQVANGWISLNGEILQVVSHTVDISGSLYPVYKVEETNDPSGAENDIDGGSVECYKIRRGVLEAVADPTGRMLALAKSLYQVIYPKILALTEYDYEMSKYVLKEKEDWVKVTPGADYTLTGVASDAQLKYRKDNISNINLIGDIICDFATGPPSSNICTLPAGYRPVVERFIKVVQKSGSAYTVIHAIVKPTGVIELGASPTNGDIFYLNAQLPIT